MTDIKKLRDAMRLTVTPWHSVRKQTSIGWVQLRVSDYMAAASAVNAMPGLLDEFDRLRDTLREVACSGVELDDERMRYVVIQICRDTWDAIRKEAGDGS